jgi:hypothetical protein
LTLISRWRLWVGPIPPLADDRDGFAPEEWVFPGHERYGFFIIIALLYLGSPFSDRILQGIIVALIKLLLQVRCTASPSLGITRSPQSFDQRQPPRASNIYLVNFFRNVGLPEDRLIFQDHPAHHFSQLAEIIFLHSNRVISCTPS